MKEKTSIMLLLMQFLIKCVPVRSDCSQSYFLINQISLIKITYLATVDKNIVVALQNVVAKIVYKYYVYLCNK